MQDYTHIYYLIGALFLGWTLFSFYASKNLPKIKVKRLSGRNGYNTLVRAVVDPRAPYPIAVLAQEVYEAKYKLHFLRMLLNKTGKYTREREIRGHEIEVQAARMKNMYIDGDDEIQHRSREAKALKAHYKGFEDMTIKDITAAMVRFKPEAIDWVRQNIDYIENEYHNKL